VAAENTKPALMTDSLGCSDRLERAVREQLHGDPRRRGIACPEEQAVFPREHELLATIRQGDDLHVVCGMGSDLVFRFQIFKSQRPLR
jgi:hypothetical protein